MKVFCIGTLDETLPISSDSKLKDGQLSEIDILKRKEALRSDFEKLRLTAIEMVWFYLAWLIS